MMATIRYLAVIVLLSCILLQWSVIVRAQSSDDEEDDFVYSKGPVPNKFKRGTRYPDRDEDVECQPIRLRAGKGSKLFQKMVTFTGNSVFFKTQNSRIMTARLHERLNNLRKAYYNKYRVRLYVLKAWTEYQDNEVSDRSLHYEGRSVRIHVTSNNVTRFLKLAIEYDFDWVQYHNDGYAVMSVIPDVCDINVDMVFVTDQSGSVGAYNNRLALNFISNVIDFFKIGENNTQVGLVTYSTFARVRFDLDDYHTKGEIQNVISNIGFPGGWTATALGLFQAGVFLNPTEKRGARPSSAGVPKIVVLITDGRSNQLPIDEVATSLHRAGVQVFTVGIGNIFLPELRFIASDPDRFHVFLLNSFSDAGGFVDFLSFTACEAPAIVEPGENTTTEVPEDGFRFFQTECTAFSPSILIEQIDIHGKCSLYASNVIANPGPLDDYSLVVRNEDKSSDRRSVSLKLKQTIKKVIYISVRGLLVDNMFSVIIWDKLFTKDHFFVYAQEGVINAEVFDLDQELTVTTESFFYRIKEGNEGGEFEIDLVTGILTVLKPLSISVQQRYDLLIVAENRNASCHRGRVKVTVVVVNNPLTLNDINATISEDIQNNTLVVQVEAQGGQGVIQYSILSGNEDGVFMIDEDNGEVTVIDSSLVDFETTQQYRLTIQATSTPNIVSVTAILTIDVLDVNEPPSFVTLCAREGLCEFDVLENQTAGLFVSDIEAEDPDLPTVNNGILVYAIDPPNVPFNISANGTLTARVLDREDVDNYNFTVVVRDAGVPSFTIQTKVVITVIDINDNRPVFRPNNLDILPLPEDLPPIALTQYVADDADINLQPISYSISTNQPNLPFRIDSRSGVLRLSAQLDFELGPRVFLFDVVATDSGGLSTNFPVVAEVIDVNDNSPIFTQDTYNANVTENSPIGTPVVTVEATDLDSGLNGKVNYMIISGNVGGLFIINETSGVISTNASIDREMVPSVTLTVEARDMGANSLNDIASVVITVLDENDNAPTFPSPTEQLIIPEDSQLGLLVTLMASDRDQPNTPNSEISYSIESGNEEGKFAVNSGNGSLSLVQSLDFETTESYTLVVVATDNGSPALSGSVTVSVTVQNVNDNAPVVSGNQDISVFESEPVGFVIAHFVASDLDENTLSFSFGAGSNDEGLFAINATGFVSLAKMLDFETAQYHTLIIVVTDGQKTTNATLRITVVDFNEFSPQFIGNNQFQVVEEEPAGTIVGSVLAEDSDTNQEIRYSFESPSTLFNIGETTGVITTATVLDREVLGDDGVFPPPDSQMQINVVATDNGLIPGQLFTVMTITITLLDINDNSPVFDQPQYQASIDEGVSLNTPLISVIATDADLGNNGTVSYQLSSQDPLPFAIDSSSGEITVTQPLDREAQRSYEFTVVASDNGTPPRSSTAPLSVTINDINDNRPIFSAPEFTFSFPETTPVGSQLFTEVATDLDDGENAVIEYSIVQEGGGAEPLFAINPTNATVSLLRSLDFETETQHTLVIQATDRGIPTLSSNTTVTINVQDIDETPPVFNGPCDASISEGLDVGTFVVSCPAVDFDDNQIQTSDIQYSITQEPVVLFNIDNNGDITTAAVLDREQTPSHQIVVRATDAAGNFAEQTATITVLDVNDNRLFFIDAPYSVDVTKQFLSSYQTELLTIVARDTDVGQNAELSFTHSVVNTLTRSVVTVTATDAGTPPLSNSTDVVINFIDLECAVPLYSIASVPGTQNAILSGQFLCSISITPPNLLLLLGDPFTVSCNVLRNVDVTVQFNSDNDGLNFFDGDLVQGQDSLNFSVANTQMEGTTVYTCNAFATGLGGISAQDDSTIRVRGPVMITNGLEDRAIELGDSVVLSCAVDTSEDILWNWLKEGSDVVSEGSRLFPVGRSLFFTSTELDDTGLYTCEVSRSQTRDTDQSSGTLTIFELPSVVQFTVTEHSDPDPNNDCNSFNSSQFQSSMTGITGQTTMVTNVTGSSLCPPDACHPNPCQNNGVCELTPSTSNGYTCQCLLGYTGPTCETDIDECANSTTCLNGGTCVNSPGAFSCNCPSGVFGDSCEYIHADCVCPPTYECILGIEGAPSECVTVQSSSNLLIVEDPVSQNTAILDQTVNTLNEDPPSTSGKRRKRETFVTVCTAKFIRTAGNPNRYLLTWMCPEGIDPPGEEELANYCAYLIKRLLVGSCSTPGGDLLSIPTVNSSSLVVSLIMVNSDTGRPLPAAETLSIIVETDAEEKMKNSGYNVADIEPLVPVTTESVSNNQVGGAVGGVFVVIAVVLVIGTIFIIMVIKFRKRKRNQGTMSTEAMYSVKLNPVVNKGDQEYDDRYIRHGGIMLPQLEDKTTYIISNKAVASPSSPPTSPTNPYTSFFDDPLYDTPTTTPASKKKQTLKTESRQNLLYTEVDVQESGFDGDSLEDSTPVPPERTTSLHPTNGDDDDDDDDEGGDEPIYGNMNIQRSDANNIGSRWEKYQKTKTILQGITPNFNKFK